MTDQPLTSNLVARLERIRARAHSLSALWCSGCSEWTHPLCWIATELDAVLASVPAAETPAEHREGTEPMSRLIGDLDWCLAQINPTHKVYEVIARVARQLAVKTGPAQDGPLTISRPPQ